MELKVQTNSKSELNKCTVTVLLHKYSPGIVFFSSFIPKQVTGLQVIPHLQTIIQVMS